MEIDFAYWPARAKVLVSEVREGASRAARERALADLWTLVNLALQRYVRAIGGRLGGVTPEDVRDIASEKALEFVGSLDRKGWSLEEYTPAQVASFFIKMARNGVIDGMRKKGRELPLLTNDDGSLLVTEEPAEGADSVESSILGPEYARAILGCFSDFTPRARLVWFLRVFYELSSHEIARHPRVATTSAAVDTMLLRCREQLRTCMNARGMDPSRMPAGTFTALWSVLGRKAEAGT